MGHDLLFPAGDLILALPYVSNGTAPISAAGWLSAYYALNIHGYPWTGYNSPAFSQERTPHGKRVWIHARIDFSPWQLVAFDQTSRPVLSSRNKHYQVCAGRLHWMYIVKERKRQRQGWKSLSSGMANLPPCCTFPNLDSVLNGLLLVGHQLIPKWLSWGRFSNL